MNLFSAYVTTVKAATLKGFKRRIKYKWRDLKTGFSALIWFITAPFVLLLLPIIMVFPAFESWRKGKTQAEIEREYVKKEFRRICDLRVGKNVTRNPIE